MGSSEVSNVCATSPASVSRPAHVLEPPATFLDSVSSRCRIVPDIGDGRTSRLIVAFPGCCPFPRLETREGCVDRQSRGHRQSDAVPCSKGLHRGLGSGTLGSPRPLVFQGPFSSLMKLSLVMGAGGYFAAGAYPCRGVVRGRVRRPSAASVCCAAPRGRSGGRGGRRRERG